MILGLSIAAFTIIHVIISLIAIVTGLVVLAAMLQSESKPWLTAIFLVTTILTSVTGFMFPINALTPALITGAISLTVLALTLRAWRWVYVVTAIAALYFNCFVLVVQSFQKIGFLRALAPSQSETPFIVAQTVVLVLFLVFGYAAVKRFHPPAMARA